MDPNTYGKVLSITYINCIEIKQNAQIEENLGIYEGVTVGVSGGKSASKIGYNVLGYLVVK